jgi:hypothetical protein
LIAVLAVAAGWAFWTSRERHYLFDNEFIEPQWLLWAILVAAAIATVTWVALGFRRR